MIQTTSQVLDVWAAYALCALEIAIICMPYVIVCAFSAAIRCGLNGKKAEAEDVLLELWRLPVRKFKQAKEIPARFKALRDARKTGKQST